MEKILTLSFAVILSIVSFSFANAQYSDNSGQNDAIAVVESFLNAQIKGDVETIRECLGGDLLKKRLRLLSNPDYPTFLYRMYKDASFKILDTKIIDKNRIQIDVEIDINNNESQRMRYLLIKKSSNPNSAATFRIYYQNELTGMH